MNSYKRKEKKTKKNDDIVLSPPTLMTLLCIYNEFNYPYGIYKEALEKYDFEISIQTIYTVVNRFKKIGWIELKNIQNRKIYKLTELGKQQVSKRCNEINKLLKAIKQI